MKPNTLQLNLFTGTDAHTRPQACTCAQTEEQRMTRKIDQAIRLLRSYARTANYALAYSGGKDSDVILRLAKLAHIDCEIVHNCTTIDPPGTIRHCERAGARIVRPHYTFFQLVSRKGLPSMFRRFCCKVLKEQYIAPYLILGIRAEESNKRKERYTEPTSCRIYSKTKTAEQVLPILNWTTHDIKIFAQMEDLQFHPLYYVNGKFDPTKRLGCIGCPLQGDRGVSDYKQYPGFLRQLVKSYAQYVDTHKAVEGIYQDVVWQLFYSNHGQSKYEQTYNGLFAPPSPKEFLQSYFNIQLP